MTLPLHFYKFTGNTTTEEIMILMNRWRNLLARTTKIGAPDHSWTEIVRAYTQPHRGYHTFQHLDECFAEFDEVRDKIEDVDAVEYTIYFHDIVYNFGKPKAGALSSEEKSAHLADRRLKEMGVDARTVAKVGKYVMWTGNHTLPTDDPDLKHLLDIDLAIFGQSEARFDEYEDQIGHEYSWASPDLYRKERAKLLTKFRAGPIYKTDYFRRKYEDRARANLARSIEKLLLPRALV